MKALCRILTSLATVAIGGPVLALTIPAVTFSGGNEVPSGDDQTAGFAFSVSNTIDVSSLGFFDSNQDGLDHSHQIGIFDNLGNLLTSATVSAGTGDSLVNQFRYVPISDILLLPGDYTIGAFFTQNDADLALIQAETFAVNTGITFGGAHQTLGTFTSPADPVDDANPGVFGPNFLFSTPVPDGGSSLALLCVGLIGLVSLKPRVR